MNLKPQDILVLLKLVALGEKPWSFSKLSIELGMSPSEVHAAAKRAISARLAVKEDDKILPNIRNLEEFLLHGVQYVFVPERGKLTRGMPTAHAAAPLASRFDAYQVPPPVWPDPEGEVRGESFSPLYKSAPKAAKNDPKLYQLLALVDAIRGGRARERELAIVELRKRLGEGREPREDAMMNDGDTLVIGPSIRVSRSALHELAKKYQIRRIALFGSAARGELRPDSDIDLLVEFEPGKAPSLWREPELREAFSRLFGGRKVDLVPPQVLNNPYRRKTIERDLRVLIDEAA